MKPLLILVEPRSSPTGPRVQVRLSTGGDGSAAGLGGFKWEAVVVRRPRFTIELVSPSLDGRVQTGRGDFAINIARMKQAKGKSLYWQGAPVTVYDASGLDLATAPIEFTGFVRTSQLDDFNDQVTLNLEVLSQALDKPALFAEFTGGGGIDGDPDFRGKRLPIGFGAVKNVEPIWFDATRNIGMIDGYGNTLSIDALFEGASDFGARVADYADYATLAARIDDKTVAPGRWATCVAEGLVGLGAPPHKPITVDAVFGSNRAGAVIRRLLEHHAGIPLEEIDVPAFDALDAAVDRPVHYWSSTERTVRDLVEAFAGSVNSTPLVTFQGLYSITRAFGGEVIGLFNRDAPDSRLRVVKWRPMDAEAPVWSMKMRAARPGVTLSVDQLLYEDDLVDKGVYSNTETYRQGHLVWNAAGAQFLYINATPAAGQPLPVLPATTTAYWQQTKPAPTAADLYYADGTPIDDLQPQEAGANVTETNVAAGISGQGDLATADTVNWGTQVTGDARPADNAGTVGNFTVIGLAAAIERIGNRIKKIAPGVHGAYDAGVVGDAQAGSAFISGRQIVMANGWGTSLALDDDATSLTELDNKFFLSCINGSGTGQNAVHLYKDGVQVAPALYFNVTDHSKAFALAYDGKEILALYDGVVRLRAPAPENLTLYPKVLPYHQGNGFTDVQYGPYSQNNFASIGGIGVPAPNATADLALIAFNGVTTTVVGNTLRNDWGADSSSAARRGEPLVGNGYAAVDIHPTGITALGLDAAATDTALNGTLAGLYYPATGNVQVYAGGVAVANVTLAAGLTGKVEVRNDGSRLGFYVAGTLVGSIAAPAQGTPLYPKFFAYTNGATYTGLVAGYYGIQPDVNTNITDSSSGAVQYLPRNEIVTPIGTAAAIAGQGDLATEDSADFATQVGGASKPAPYADVTTFLTTNGTQTSHYLLQGNEVVKLGNMGSDWSEAEVLTYVLGGPQRFTWRASYAGEHAASLLDGVNYFVDGHPYQVRCRSDGSVDAYTGTTNNGQVMPPGSWDAGTVLDFVYDDVTIQFRANGVTKYTWFVGAGLKFAGHIHIKTAGTYIRGIVHGPYKATADVNSNVVDSFGGAVQTLPRNELVTPLGTAAAIAGQGDLATQDTVTWQSQVTGTGRPADNAGSTIPQLIPGGATASFSIQGNTLVCTEYAAWGAWAYSNLAMLGSAMVAARLDTTVNGPAFGMASPANKNVTSWTSLAYGLYRESGDGSLRAMEGGSIITLLAAASWSANDVLSITYDGRHVRYMQNDTVIRTVVATGGLALHCKVMFDNPGGAVRDLQFGPFGQVPIAGANILDTDTNSVVPRTNLITSLGTAAAISGQGALATKSAVDLATAEVLNKSLANVDATASTKLGGIAAGATVGAVVSANLYRSDGTTVLLQAEVRTAEGVASSIAGQGALATLSAVTFNTSTAQGFGGLAGRENVRLGTEVKRADGTTTVNDADAITSLGIASAIVGQAATATNSDFSAITGATKPEANATYTKNMQAWAAATAYKVGDFVQYANSSWIATAAHTSDALYPPGHASNTQFQILAQAGHRTEIRYKKSNATPATPTGDDPAGWTVARPSTPTDQADWEIRGQKNSLGQLQGVWSAPVKVSGTVPRGAYQTNTLYYSGDTVTYNGGTYHTLQDNFQNQAPTGTAQANSYWGVTAAPGETAGTGAQTLTLTLSAGAIGSTTNLRSMFDAAGYTGGDLTGTVNISGTYRGPAGGYGIRSGTFPTNKTVAITINVQSGGIVDGGGGTGGAGGEYVDGSFGGSGFAGGNGSDAFFIEHNISGGITIAAGGAVNAGSGGFAGGAVSNAGGGGPTTDYWNGGTGGAGGFPNGNPGGGGLGVLVDTTEGYIVDYAPAYDGPSGAAGTTGMTPAANNSAAAGYAVRKNGFTCTVTNNGTMNGSAA